MQKTVIALLSLVAALLVAILIVITVKQDRKRVAGEDAASAIANNNSDKTEVANAVARDSGGVSDEMLNAHTQRTWTLIKSLANSDHVVDGSRRPLSPGSDDLIDVLKGKRVIASAQDDRYKIHWLFNEEESERCSLLAHTEGQSGFDQVLFDRVMKEWDAARRAFGEEDGAAGAGVILAANDIHREAETYSTRDDSRMAAIEANRRVVVRRCEWIAATDRTEFSLRITASGKYYWFACEFRDIASARANDHVQIDLRYWPKHEK